MSRMAGGEMSRMAGGEMSRDREEGEDKGTGAAPSKR